MPREGYDSVVGREGQRGVDEWVFFRQDQLLPCFLVDEPLGRQKLELAVWGVDMTATFPRLGLILAREAAQAAIKAGCVFAVFVFG